MNKKINDLQSLLANDSQNWDQPLEDTDILKLRLQNIFHEKKNREQLSDPVLNTMKREKKIQDFFLNLEKTSIQ